MTTQQIRDGRSVTYRRTLGRALFELLIFVSSLFSLLLSWLFWQLFFFFYWPYRDLFESRGKYYNPEDGVVYGESSFVFVFPAGFFLFLGLILFLVRYSQYRSEQAEIRRSRRIQSGPQTH